jgi:1-acyl-sn-glycerol-3-phosphate acyltransferase
MGTYVVLSNVNSAGVKAIRQDPDRLIESNRQIERLEGKVIEQFALLGQYDFCAIVSAPDNSAIHQMAVDRAASGRTRFTVLPAIDLPLFARLLGQTTETTGPYRWQISWWAQLIRRAYRYQTITKAIRAHCSPLAIEGRENLRDLKSPAVFIGNHSSHLDATVLFHSLPERFRWRIAFGGAADRWFIKRKEWRKSGWYYSLTMNTFPIHRGGGGAALDYAKWLIDRNWSVMIFPEGTRSSTGKMAKFRHGVSILALEKDIPVVPIYMEGLREIRPKGQTVAGRGPVTVKIGEPIRFPPGTPVPEATQALYRAMDSLRQQVHRRKSAVLAAPEPVGAAGGGAG